MVVVIIIMVIIIVSIIEGSSIHVLFMALVMEDVIHFNTPTQIRVYIYIYILCRFTSICFCIALLVACWSNIEIVLHLATFPCTHTHTHRDTHTHTLTDTTILKPVISPRVRVARFDLIFVISMKFE